MDLNISNHILYFYKNVLNFTFLIDCDSMISSPSSVSASREAPCDKRNLKKGVELNNSIYKFIDKYIYKSNGFCCCS